MVESFGLGAVEAMACGRPVVATRAGGLTEAVADGRTGFLAEPGDTDALAAACMRTWTTHGCWSPTALPRERGASSGSTLRGAPPVTLDSSNPAGARRYAARAKWLV